MGAIATVLGLTIDDKRPGDYVQTDFGVGRISANNAIRVLVTGTKIAAGSMTADSDLEQITSEDDADDKLGAGSEGAIQCYGALSVPGVEVWAAPVAEAGGAVGATLTVTMGGAWTGTGTLVIDVGDRTISCSIADGGGGSPDDDTATAFTASVNSDPQSFASAAAVAAVVTLTTKSKGIRTNDWYAKVNTEKSQLLSGFTCVLAGDAGGATASGWYPFGATPGSGADDITNVLALLTTEEWQRLAVAQSDSTNMALVIAQVNSEASALIKHREHVVIGFNGTDADSITAGATDNNAYRVQVMHSRFNRVNPIKWAAEMAAWRAVTEGTNPNPNYDGLVLNTAAAQDRADIAIHSEVKTLLNNGVTPVTTINGKATVERAIVSHCKTGTVYDYRTLDTGDATTPDRIAQEIELRSREAREEMPYAGPDLAAEEMETEEETLRPATWAAICTKELKNREKQNWVTAVDDNPVEAEWNDDAERIDSAIPCVVKRHNHQIGSVVRQIAT